MSYTRTFRAKALMLTPMGYAGPFRCFLGRRI
jgi:hypothetical protein